MRYILMGLRTLLAMDTLLGLLALPLLIAMTAACLLHGQFLAAAAIVVTYSTIGIIYGRYWRRFPFWRSR